jgi:uncharacterized cupin superfamily protein
VTQRPDGEADTLFPMLGVNLAVLEPGEPNATYHWETEAEAFLVLPGEAPYGAYTVDEIAREVPAN